MKILSLGLGSIRGMTLLAGVMFLVAGCQTPGKTLIVDSSGACPSCKTLTKTTPIAGLTYKKHVCPGCRTIDTKPSATRPDDAYWEASIDLLYLGQSAVHVCPKCDAVVEKCRQCSKQ